ncbi:hypothetical protein CR513_48296, partial [Mucuna pruriens]
MNLMGSFKYSTKEFKMKKGTPQQNGVVERKNITLQEMARTMLCEKSLPKNLWNIGEALRDDDYIIDMEELHQFIINDI